VASMAQLNAPAARAMRRVGVRAATDITGLGLLGHLGEIMQASGVSAEIEAAAVPMLPTARKLAEQGVVPGGTTRNLRSAERFTDFGPLEEARRIVLADAQTSGGLLMAVAAPLAKALLQALTEEGVTGTLVGRVVERQFSDGPSGRITVLSGGDRD